MEIDTNLLIFLSIALVGALSLYSIRKSHQGKNKVELETPKGVKRTSQEGQENFVEVLKDSAAEALAFKDTQIDAHKKEIRSLQGQVTKLKGLMYGTADEREIAAIEQEEKGMIPNAGRQNTESNVSEDVVNMRLRLMADKLKIDPVLMQFDAVRDAFRDIASDPRFDEIAAAALRNSGQSATVPQNTNDL